MSASTGSASAEVVARPSRAAGSRRGRAAAAGPGLNRATCRAISLPIEPPAPVTRTVAPFEVVGDLVRVDRRVLAAEQVGEVEIAEAAQQRPADRGRTRGRRTFTCASVRERARRRSPAISLAARVRQRDQHAIDRVLLGRRARGRRSCRARAARARSGRAAPGRRRRSRRRCVSLCVPLVSSRASAAPGVARTDDQRAQLVVGLRHRADARARTGALGTGCRRSRAARGARRPAAS